MAIFELIRDTKVVVWRRDHVKVEAESIGAAAEQLGTASDWDPTNTIYLMEGESELTPEDCDGNETVAILDADDEHTTLWSNAPEHTHGEAGQL